MHRLAEDCARDLPLEQQEECRSNVHAAFKRFVLGDAALVCSLRNHGSSGDIPAEALQILREHDAYESHSLVNLFAPGNEVDAIRIYREVQAELFAHVLLTVFHKGNIKRVANDLSSIKQSVLLYQLATDLLHVKNASEPTFGRLPSHLSVTKQQFALDEARYLIRGPLRQRMLGWVGFLAVGALCRMSGKQAEWEKQPSR